MSEKLYLYPIWLRVWHAINALVILILIATGISLQYIDINFEMMKFDSSVTFHNIAGYIMGINYTFFVIANFVTGNIRFYRIKPKGLVKKLLKQSNYYAFGMFKGEKTPYPITKDRKFNPLQKVTYVFFMFVIVPLLIISGLALLFPEFILPRVLGFSGIQLTAMLHASTGFLVSLFLIIHIYISTTGKPISANFKSILNGYHE
jgi:thiosulfate reductase cytochrome b subunit